MCDVASCKASEKHQKGLLELSLCCYQIASGMCWWCKGMRVVDMIIRASHTSGCLPGLCGDFSFVWWHHVFLGASCSLSGAYDFEVSTRFLENLCIAAIHGGCFHRTSKLIPGSPSWGGYSPSASQDISQFVEPESILLCSQEHATYTYPEPHEPTQHRPILHL